MAVQGQPREKSFRDVLSQPITECGVMLLSPQQSGEAHYEFKSQCHRKEKHLLTNTTFSLVPVAHACNPSYSAGPAWANSL
jgi:hypothetical protein